MAKSVVLPVVLPATPAFSRDVTLSLYISRPNSELADEDALRSLVVANIPVSTTDLHLRHLFGNQLSGGLVERVEFQNERSRRSLTLAEQPKKSSKKRKRMTVNELEQSLDRHGLPDIWRNTMHMGNENVVVTFVDRPSMEASFKGARMAAKAHKRIVWGQGIEDRIPAQGEQLYARHNELQYPSRQELLRHAEDYLTIYAEMEEAKARENAKKRQMPDEDGFITVMKGSRGFVRKEDAEALVEKAKEKAKGLDNFYRFQMREKRKEEQGELMRRFEEDKQKVEEMKMRRGPLKVSIPRVQAETCC
jgi:Ribosomal RNA-processing protein 7 (RRP7) C-terminal domain/Rrp7 RRM-like N-terminal domain